MNRFNPVGRIPALQRTAIAEGLRRWRLPLLVATLAGTGVWTLAQQGTPAPAVPALPGQSLPAASLDLSPAASSQALPAGKSAAPMPMRTARMPVGCMISPKRIADIGASVVGVARVVHVDVGDDVRKGQSLVQLSADVENASVQAAEARSDVDADIRAAEANLELARQRHARARELLAQGFVSSQASDQAAAELKVAGERVAQARGQQRVTTREAGIARAQLGQRTLKSPFGGVVVERFVNAGERVEDKPVLRIAQLDPLRVEIIVPAARWGSLHAKDELAVQPELPGVGPVMARVVHVDRLIDPASNTFRVRLDLPNKDHALPGGARCKVELPEAADAPAAVARKAAADAAPAATAPVPLRRRSGRSAGHATPYTPLAPLLPPSKIIG
jgi:RND family efflux transporter MFP subunit